MGEEEGHTNKSGSKRITNYYDNKDESPAGVAQHQPSKKKNRKEVAIFGNYRHYYGYRVGHNLDEDPRLKVMKRDWFEGKQCLDIGCNSGLITIAIAKKYGCQSILGVDIDGDRIEEAYWTLRQVMKPKAASQIPKSTNVESANGLTNIAIDSLIEQARDSNGNSPDLHKIVTFQKGNFVQNWHPPTNTHYHAIICLSVTKWVHLNWGDDGIVTLFSRVWRLLKPGGVFIVEPQPWSSYYNNRHVSETAATNYKSIQIRPEDFQDILLDKIGFRQVENLTPGLSGTKTGFDRPILAFWK